MKVKGKKIVPFVLVFSLVALSGNLYAKKQGDYLITKKGRYGSLLLSFNEPLHVNSLKCLLPAYKGFLSFRFLKLYNGSYILKMPHLPEATGEEKFKLIPRIESRIKQYGSRIDHIEAIQVDKEGSHSKKPPLKLVRIAGEVLLGGTLGFVGGSVGVLVGLSIGGHDTDMRNAVAGVAGAIGLTFGSSLGVYLIGNIGNETGSYWSTFSGSAVGVATSFFLFFVLRGEPENTMGLIFSTLPAVGGVLGFNMTRRYQTPPTSGTSFINFSDGKMNFAFPKIYFRPNPSVKGDLIQTINLLEVIF